MKKIILALYILCLISCNNRNEQFTEERIVEIELNNDAEKALNNVTNILNKDDYRNDLNSLHSQTTEIYYTLTNKEKYIIFKLIGYSNRNDETISNITNTKIYLDDLIKENIELSIDYMPILGGNYGSVTLKSKFSKKDVFIIKKVDFKDSKKETIKYNNFHIISLSPEKANSLTKQLKIFLSNIE